MKLTEEERMEIRRKIMIRALQGEILSSYFVFHSNGRQLSSRSVSQILRGLHSRGFLEKATGYDEGSRREVYKIADHAPGDEEFAAKLFEYTGDKGVLRALLTTSKVDGEQTTEEPPDIETATYAIIQDGNPREFTYTNAEEFADVHKQIMALVRETNETCYLLKFVRCYERSIKVRGM